MSHPHGLRFCFFKKRKKKGWLTNGGWSKIRCKQGGSDVFIPNDPKSRIAFTLLDFFVTIMG